MSERWKAVAEQLLAVEHEQTDLTSRQLNACLVAMARHLVEVHRAHGDLTKDEDEVLVSPRSVATTEQPDRSSI